MYTRVIPRDLFNESKLLKCLGQLALLVHNGVDNEGRAVPQSLKVEHDGSPFGVEQCEADGGLYCTTVWFRAGDQRLELYTNYNDRSPYPLLCDGGDSGYIEVFEDDGSLTASFVEYVEGLT